MTLRENAAILETYLHNIRNIEEMPPGPAELDALDAVVEAMICLGQAERRVCSNRQTGTSETAVFEQVPGESKKRRDTELD